MLGKSVAAFLIVRLFGYPNSHALIDLGEPRADRRVLLHPGGLGVSLALLPEPGRDLILAGAIISILLNPVAVRLRRLDLARPAASPAAAPDRARLRRRRRRAASREPIPATTLTDHVVLVGYGRVGSIVGDGLKSRGCRCS